MHAPVNLCPLESQHKVDIGAKLRSGTLGYSDLTPLVRFLAFESPRVLVITSTCFNSTSIPNESSSSDQGVQFQLAAAATRKGILSGELPTVPAVKYCSRLLNEADPFEQALLQAAIICELFLSDRLDLYPRGTFSREISELLSIAKGIGIPTQFLEPRGLSAVLGSISYSAVASAKEKYDKLEATPLSALQLSEDEERDIESKFKNRSLLLSDARKAALYLYERAKIVVESPYAPHPKYQDNKAESLIDRSINLDFAYLAQRQVLLSGMLPSASHTEYTFEGILNDDIVHERVLGIAVGLAKTVSFDETFMFDNRGISSGMEKAANFAAEIGRPVLRQRNSDLDPVFWRGTFDDYLEDALKPNAFLMEAAMEFRYPEESTPGVLELLVKVLPYRELSSLIETLDDERFVKVSSMLSDSSRQIILQIRAEIFAAALENENPGIAAIPFGALGRARIASGTKE